MFVGISFISFDVILSFIFNISNPVWEVEQIPAIRALNGFVLTFQ